MKNLKLKVFFIARNEKIFKNCYFVFWDISWGPIQLINTKITLDMALCELTLANLVLYEIAFLGQFFCLHINVESSVLFCEIIHICKVFVN